MERNEICVVKIPKLQSNYNILQRINLWDIFLKMYGNITLRKAAELYNPVYCRNGAKSTSCFGVYGRCTAIQPPLTLITFHFEILIPDT